MEVTKVYKPEVSKCPLCGHKLKYRYAVSNKVIQFYNGHYTRVKNLGYSCTNENCVNDLVYTSQTASKLCVKGYTYSAKVLALIVILKEMKCSREYVCDRLASMGVEISDRNIDIIYRKYLDNNIDYKSNILNEYNFMHSNYGQVRISIDAIKVEKKLVLSIRNSFNSDQIGFHILDLEKEELAKSILHDYVDDLRVKCITTVRPFTNFFKLLKSCINRKIEFLHFEKI